MATAPGLIVDIDSKRLAGSTVPLFAGLRLDVAASSVVALIGPSGIGKSTLLRMIAGIDADFDGQILVDGQAAAKAPVPGFVFQDARLLPWLTAIDNVRLGSQDCTPAMAEAALDRVGLGEATALHPHQLSGGMQRRVALARALVGGAGLLLLDEPFVSLDRALLSEMQQVFQAVVAATGPTVVFVSHLVDDAARLADRAILLDRRPAQIMADIALPVPPSQRDETLVAAYRSLLDKALRP